MKPTPDNDRRYLGVFVGRLEAVADNVGYIRGYAGPSSVRVVKRLLNGATVGNEILYEAVEGPRVGALAVRVLKVTRS
jgi:hypothetical protein